MEMKFDFLQLTTALEYLFAPGEVLEIRVLGATSRYHRREHVVSGYFDYENIKAIPAALSNVEAAKGVYYTINPVDPDLLARRANRLAVVSGGTTSDSDIPRRKRILVDCDANRKSDMSATDEEKVAATELVLKIKESLSALGFPQPIVVDSGNGTQLLYACDLPVENYGQVERFLQAVSQASTLQAHIDTSVFNPSRIARLPGTMNCKGDDFKGSKSPAARPHRMAQVIEMPEVFTPVTAELLSDFTSTAGTVESSPAAPATPLPATGGFVIDEWIQHYCPDIGAAQNYKNGRKWLFPVCPFDENHAPNKAGIFESSNGALSFKCQHNSCSGNKWPELRTLLGTNVRPNIKICSLAMAMSQKLLLICHCCLQ